MGEELEALTAADEYAARVLSIDEQICTLGEEIAESARLGDDARKQQLMRARADLFQQRGEARVAERNASEACKDLGDIALTGTGRHLLDAAY